jgi:hypothetical protein
MMPRQAMRRPLYPPPGPGMPRSAMPRPALPPPAMPPPNRPPPQAMSRPIIPLDRKPMPPATSQTPYVTNLENGQTRAPRGPSPNAPPPPNPTRAVSPGPPGPKEERYSWYPDIARSYEESHYEPSINAPERKREGEEEESELEKEEPKPPMTKWERYQKHLRRRWYFYAVGLVLGLAIGLPIM